MNLHSASPDRLEPLPFHAMTPLSVSRAGERYPETPRASPLSRRGTTRASIGAPVPPWTQAATSAAMTPIRYAAAACQTDLPNPLDRDQMRDNTDRMLAMIQCAVDGSAPFLPVRLVVFPEFAHAAPVFATVAGAARQARRADSRTSTPIASHAKARELDIYIQTGSMIESDPRWPARSSTRRA